LAEFPFAELPFDELVPTLASAFAFSDVLPAALCALLAAVFAIDCVLETAPLMSALPVAEPPAATEPPPDAALALPLPEPFAAFPAPCAVFEAEDCAVFAVPVAADVVPDVSAFPCALA